MQEKITRPLFEAYLECKFKSYLRAMDQVGVKSDFEKMIESRKAVEFNVAGSMFGELNNDNSVRDVVLTPRLLKAGNKFILNGYFENGSLSIQIDGLRRTDGESKFGGFHYVPILFDGGNNAKRQIPLLQLLSFALAELQGHWPKLGLVQKGGQIKRVPLDVRKGPAAIRQLLDEICALCSSDNAPKLLLNDHCSICEFRERCDQQARSEDSLSQLRGITEKEIARYSRKGIFTLTQLAHTFRPRRKGKGRGTSTRHFHELKAMSVLTNKVYVYGSPAGRHDGVQIYVDFEGLPDEGYIYLIGMLMIDGTTVTTRSFWADSKDDEIAIFDSFLGELARFETISLFTYGSYEKSHLVRVKGRVAQRLLIEKAIDAIVNVLSQVYSHVYFPTYSNGLKEIAGFLGYRWADPNSSGIQSIVWRKHWEQTKDVAFKEKLIVYNQEDCTALKAVSDHVASIASQCDSEEASGSTASAFVQVRDLKAWANNRNFGSINFENPDLSFVNSCSYFDYQRERVFMRTSKTLRKRRPASRKRQRSLRVTKEFEIIDSFCPKCGGKVLGGVHTGKLAIPFPRRKQAFDMLLTPTGVKRAVYVFKTSVHRCCKCNHVFVPAQHLRLDSHFHGLKSWVIYQHVEHRLSFGAIKSMLKEFFGLRLDVPRIHMFKSLMARQYRRTWRLILQKIQAGNLIHADETEVKLKGGTGYVWVFTSLEEVIYLFKPTREGGFLKDFIKGFKGVLVSDFYCAYDTLECSQQKCLAHLIRDMNQELLNHPFDDELRSITQPFGQLLRVIVTSIDEHGLKRRHLVRHKRKVNAFFKCLIARTFHSEAALALQKRLLKNEHALFTFMEHDGVPWNNNNAEHAIKSFAYYRQLVSGLLCKQGLEDYLVLLSISETCRYRGVSFLRFLFSGCRSVDTLCRLGRRLPKLPEIQLYPRGFVPPYHLSRERNRQAKFEAKRLLLESESQTSTERDRSEFAK